jgi:hypothetical protein
MLWFVGAVVGAVALFKLLQAINHRGILAHLARYLQERENGAELRALGDRLELHFPGREPVEANFRNLRRAIFRAKAVAYHERAPVFERWLAVLHEFQAIGAPTLERDGSRLLPRLVPAGFFAGLPPFASDMPRTPLGDTGLFVVYVLDNQRHVAYLTAKQLGQLGLTVEALHEKCLANLRARFSDEAVRKVLGASSIAAFKTGDTFDAARVLLVPSLLADGEALIALLPDRDTLLLAPLPGADGLAQLRALARKRSGDLLLDVPLKVTRAGFELLG